MELEEERRAEVEARENGGAEKKGYFGVAGQAGVRAGCNLYRTFTGCWAGLGYWAGWLGATERGGRGGEG